LIKQSEIKRIVESRFEKSNKSLDKIIKHFNIEEIHDFRVQVKKVRAFIRLAATRLSDPAELKIPHHLKSMYRYAGSLRNLQLQQQRILEFIEGKEINQPYQYLKILLHQEEEFKQKINELFRQKVLEAEEEMIIGTLPGKLGKTTLKYYTQKKADELKLLVISPEHTDEELHQLRKILKDILYTLSYTGDYFFSFFKGGLQSKEEIESLTDLLGEFQDVCISLKLLEPVYTNELNDQEEITLLQIIREEWVLKKSGVKAAICENLDQIHPAIQVPV
jgi:CHAD domain-containing protein